MDKLEKVELIREKTGVSYDDANVALDACNEDVLEAIIWLERMGKTAEKTTAYTTTAMPGTPLSPEMERAQSDYAHSSRQTKVGQGFTNLGSALKRLITKGLESSFVVERKEEQILSAPTLVLVFCLLWWGAAIPLLIFGLFMGCHYHFEGAGEVGSGVNQVMDAVADGAESIKRTVMGNEEDE